MVKEFNFEKYFDCILKIIPINFVALIAMTLYRVFFFFYFADFVTLNAMTGYILKSFWLGLRFDLSVLAYINSFVILIFTLFLLIRNLKVFKTAIKLIKIYYWFAFTIIAFVTAVDFGFFTYFGEHINLLFFQFFEDDTYALIKTIVKDWRFPIAVIILIFVSSFAYTLSSWTTKKLMNNNCLIDTYFWNILVKAFIILLIPVLTFLFARGSLSMFPLGTFYTQISPNAFVNKISITAAHSLTDAIQAKAEQSNEKIDIVAKLGMDRNSIDLSVFNKISIKNDVAKQKQPNVVFIILEGFGELPVLYNSKDFNVLGELKEHFDNDIVLHNFLAAGQITIHCLESTILNMPQRPFAMQITQSPKAFNHYTSAAPLPFKNEGYITKAIYGGSLNWRGIDKFFTNQGFDETYGEGSIKNEYRHEWGINDAQFFELVLRELKDNKGSPVFIYAMSTATHPPYETPPYYKPLPVEIPADLIRMMPNEKKYGKKIFETYQFANREAAKFISAVKNSEFADNTIIVITGDHNLREISASTVEEIFKKYAVPMYIYIPKNLKKPIDVNKAGSHMDIMPTLYDLALSETQYIAAGTSLLDSRKKHIAFNNEGFIVSGNKAVLYDITTDTAIYFNFDRTKKMLSVTQETKEHAEMLNYYKTTVAASDVYLNQN